MNGQSRWLVFGLVYMTSCSAAYDTNRSRLAGEVTQYFEHVIVSLERAQRASEQMVMGGGERVAETPAGMRRLVDRYAAATHRAQGTFQEAVEQIRPFEIHANPLFSTSAKNLVAGYEAMQAVSVAFGDKLRELYGGEHPQAFRLEQMTSVMQSLSDTDAVRAQGKMLDGCIAATYLLVEMPKHGYGGGLILTVAQRDALLESLRTHFPKTAGKRWGSETLLERAAWEIHRVLTGAPIAGNE